MSYSIATIRCLALMLCFLQVKVTAQKIVAIDFENLNRTKPTFLMRYLDLQLGQKVDSVSLEQSAQNLRNLNLFLSVDASIVPVDSTHVKLVFSFKESNYTYPIFSVGGFDDKLNLSLGVGDINFRGRGESFGLLYQYYDRHSFRLYHSSLFLGKSRLGHEFSLGKLSTVEPLYFNQHTNLFNFDNYHASAGIHYWLTRDFRIGIGTMYMYERYVNRGENVLFDEGQIASNSLIELLKVQMRTYTQLNRINYLYERRQGFQNTLSSESIRTIDYPEVPFFRISNEFKSYWLLGHSGVLNFRNRIGISTNIQSPFSPFVIDGFINIRGSGDRVARGTGEFIVNMEYSHTLVDHNWFYLMTNAFTDIGYLRPAGGSFNYEIKNNENAFYYSGIGLKLQSKKFYNSLIRVDFGCNLKDTKQSGVVFGFGNFF